MVAGPQSSNIFNGLAQNKNYILAVSDTCGRGTNVTMNFSSNNIFSVSYNTTSMPCVGYNVVLTANNLNGIGYQWYKNNVAILNDILSNKNINNITSADNGQYKVRISAGSCITNYNVIDLDVSKCGTALPLQIINFKGMHYTAKNVLSFESVNNENVRHYILERSTGTKNWSDLHVFNANTDLVNRFSYEDNNIIESENDYYRVKQANEDNSREYTNVIKLNGNAVVHNYTIYPNPANTHFIIKNLNVDAKIKVYNNFGQQVMSLTTSSFEQNMDISRLVAGVYLVKIESNDGQVVSLKLNVIK